MKAIVHIGMPKAGSTTIQTFLQKNISNLQKQSFRYFRNLPKSSSQIEFPAAARGMLGEVIPQTNNMADMFSLRSPEDHKSFLEKFEREFSSKVESWNEDTYLISSEHIVPWTRKWPHVQAMDDFLKRYFSEVEYLIYVRRQEELILSSYSERIKRGETLSFDEHFESRKKYNFMKMIRQWSDGLGRDRLTVRLLERDFLVNGDLLDDYCQVTGIDRAPLSTPGRVNESLSAEATECLRRINRFLSTYEKDGSRNEFRDRFQNQLMRKSQTQPNQKMTSVQLAEVRELNAKSNELVRRHWFPERAELFPDTPERYVDEAQNYQSASSFSLARKNLSWPFLLKPYGANK
ncbi:MAG: hypothetical protein ABJO67_12420 [Pseudoruegeria sp.]